MVLPEFWQRFLQENDLVFAEINIPEDCDLTGVGAIIEILDEKNAQSEAYDSFPGRGVFSDGFIPVGGCAVGTGDPYFINVHDGEAGPLYRIAHDRVFEHGYDRNAAVAVVLADYRHLLQFREDAA